MLAISFEQPQPVKAQAEDEKGDEKREEGQKLEGNGRGSIEETCEAEMSEWSGNEGWGRDRENDMDESSLDEDL